MGIRALGFLKPSDYGNDTKFIASLRENLFKLGAFGFENWQAKIYSLRKDKSTEPAIRLLCFNDTPDQNILITRGSILVGDSHFQNLLKNIGLAVDKKSRVFQIQSAQ